MKSEILTALQEQYLPKAEINSKSLKKEIQELIDKIQQKENDIKTKLETSHKEKEELEKRKLELIECNKKLKDKLKRKQGVGEDKKVPLVVQPIPETVGIDWEDSPNDLDVFSTSSEATQLAISTSSKSNISPSKNKTIYGSGIFIPSIKK